MNGDFLFEAIGYVGADLVDAAEQKHFSGSAWRRWGVWAACLVLTVCVAAVSLPKLMPQEQAPVEVPQVEQEVVLMEASFQLDGLLYYVDDYNYASAGFSGKPFTQTQLQQIAGAAPLDAEPDWISTDVLEDAVFYTADVQSAQRLGQPIEPQSLILAAEDGLHLAYTYGEQPGLRYTYDKAAAASHQTLLEIFVLPLERQFSDHTLQFSSASDLKGDQLLNLFRGILALEDAAGIRSLAAERKEMQKDCTDITSPMVYAAADIQDKLNRYFSGCGFGGKEPVEVAVPGNNGISARLETVEFRQGTQLMILQAELYYEEALLGEKTYTVQFTADGFRYVSVVCSSAP